MKIIHRNIVSAMIFSKDGKLFQGKKHPENGGVYSGFWHIPGGGVKEGENKIEALKREILEETGIDISKYKIELLDDSGSRESDKILKDTGEKVLCKMKFFVYKVAIGDKRSDEIKVRIGSDLSIFRWSDINDCKEEEITPPSRALFKRLGFI